ncbi:unnamed protein product [Caenorhabditis angaria]|uniref:SGNH domain-containing protein n=1 Tax=Caenorhabditis angaria TaxID=860376 RepID=A0A9P1IQX6_9PELO|nr:unnamed protein product [Caenorhabditis angaria]
MSKKGHLQGIRAIAIISVLAFHFFPKYFPNGFLGVDHVFARIWQFLAGFLVYFWQENEEEKLLDFEEKKEKLSYGNVQNLLLLATFLILFLGIELPGKIVRIIVTIITALLILISENNQILSNKIMIYIGNISYSLYLIHWPIYCYSKFYELPKLPFLCFSIFLGILIYETYEKWYTTRLTRNSQCILSTILLIFCILIIWRQEIHEIYDGFTGKSEKFAENPIFSAGNSKNLSPEEVMTWNTRYTDHEKDFLKNEQCEYKNRDLAPFGLCEVKNLTSSAPLKILILGNSYATNLAPLIIKSCSKKSRRIWLASNPGCDFLHQGFGGAKKCQEILPAEFGTTEKEQFDYVFLISKCGEFCERAEAEAEDAELEFAKSQIASIRNSVRHKIFIQNAVTIPSGVRGVNDYLKIGMKFEEIDKIYSQRLKHHKFIGDARHRKLGEFCGEKCEYFDAFQNFPRNPYAPEEIFRFFDERGLLTFIYFLLKAKCYYKYLIENQKNFKCESDFFTIQTAIYVVLDALVIFSSIFYICILISVRKITSASNFMKTRPEKAILYQTLVVIFVKLLCVPIIFFSSISWFSADIKAILNAKIKNLEHDLLWNCFESRGESGSSR